MKEIIYVAQEITYDYYVFKKVLGASTSLQYLFDKFSKYNPWGEEDGYEIVMDNARHKQLTKAEKPHIFIITFENVLEVVK